MYTTAMVNAVTRSRPPHILMFCEVQCHQLSKLMSFTLLVLMFKLLQIFKTKFYTQDGCQFVKLECSKNQGQDSFTPNHLIDTFNIVFKHVNRESCYFRRHSNHHDHQSDFCHLDTLFYSVCNPQNIGLQSCTVSRRDLTPCMHAQYIPCYMHINGILQKKLQISHTSMNTSCIII